MIDYQKRFIIWRRPGISSKADDFIHSLISKREFPAINTGAAARYITGI